MAPQARRDILFSFALEAPRDMTVTGLGNLEPTEKQA